MCLTKKWVGPNTVPVRWSQESVAPGIVAVVIDRGDGTQAILKAGGIFGPTAKEICPQTARARSTLGC
jgi:hypothetical protein